MGDGWLSMEENEFAHDVLASEFEAHADQDVLCDMKHATNSYVSLQMLVQRNQPQQI